MATAARMAPVPAEAEARVPEKTKSPIETYHWLRCETTVEIPVSKFTVGDLLKLHQGGIVPTATRVANDVPIRINKTLLGWGRFEVVNDRLAIRITELA
jgi:flagellar motor switch/type III secretory pathway protein FliN